MKECIKSWNDCALVFQCNELTAIVGGLFIRGKRVREVL